MKKMVSQEEQRVQKNCERVPFLPADLPFNEQQKNWMAGFLSGLHTRLLVKEESGHQQKSEAVALRPLMIIYGSQTGNAETVADDAAELAKAHGLSPNVIDMDDVELDQLVTAERLLVITSTYGEGEMPDNAQALWDMLSADDAPRLDKTNFSVFALGDTNYDGFCLAGKLWDQRLEELGAQRICDRADCDVDFSAAAESWMTEAVPTIATKGSEQAAGEADTSKKKKKAKSKYNRQNPLIAELIGKKRLNKDGSSKETMHFEFSLAGSGESYEAGDALNIIPVNRPELVTDIIRLLDADAEQQQPFNGKSLWLDELLTNELEIRTPSKELLSELARGSGDAELTRLLENDDAEALADFLWGKDIVDLLIAYPAQLSVAEFIAVCKPLAPRAYSISSSIKKHTEEVHLTIASVRYEGNEREHHGVCSAYLADIAKVGDHVKCYFSPNKNFSVPKETTAPMIMVGPGTGIAPFRAFLEERESTGATGKNWLFFGDRNSQSDFIYQDEIEAMQSSGLLTNLDLAFSRDQEKKIYVQDRMLEKGAELFAWLEEGGYFFICGDAYRMAKDVDKALSQLIETHGEMSSKQASDYIAALKKQKRYVRDVY